MISLLTEELKKTNEIQHTNLEKIKNDYFNKEKIEYSLNIHKFNPSNNSPPNDWNYRLKKRLQLYK